MGRMKVLEEENAMNQMLKDRSIDKEDSEKIVNIYNKLKDSVPESIRDICSFRYFINKKEGYIKMNIYNCRAFLIPYEKDKVQIIYPEEKIKNLKSIISENRLKELCGFCKFINFPCYVLYLKIDEVDKFEDEHWESFSYACKLAEKGSNKKVLQDTINVDWNEEL